MPIFLLKSAFEYVQHVIPDQGPQGQVWTVNICKPSNITSFVTSQYDYLIKLDTYEHMYDVRTMYAVDIIIIVIYVHE